MFVLATKISDITVEEIFQFGFPIMIGLAIIAWILYGAMKYRREVEDGAQPVLEAAAKVIDKQQIAPNSITIETWVMFETNSGNRMRLVCKPNNDYIIGDKGYLVWQGSRLISFERGKNGPERSVSASNAHGGATAPQGYIPMWKRIEMMEAEKQLEEQKNAEQKKCVFCGQLLQEGQIFCGVCGRRQD